MGGGAFVILWPRESQEGAPGGIWGLKRRVRDHKSVDERCTGDHGVPSSVLYGQPTFSTEKQHMISPKAVFVGRTACSANGQWRPSCFRALQSSPATTGAPMKVEVPCNSILYTCCAISGPITEAGAFYIWRLPRHCDITHGGEKTVTWRIRGDKDF